MQTTGFYVSLSLSLSLQAPSVVVEEGDSRASLKRVSCYPEVGERCSPPPSKQARQEEHQRGTKEQSKHLTLHSLTTCALKKYIYIYIYTYVCVCVAMCIYVYKHINKYVVFIQSI